MSQFRAFDRINVGCGFDQRPEYLNVDMDPACKPDLLLKDNDFSVLPKRHFSELLAHDVLEHIPRAQTMSALLEWADLLQVGGRIIIQTSSILGVARMIERQQNFAHHHGCTICLFGNQAHPGDFHHTGFTDQTLKTYVISAGFEIDSFSVHDDWLYHLTANRAYDWTQLLDTHGGASDAEFLSAAYDQALSRQPEEPFLSIHLRELACGQPRRALLKTLFSSLERNIHVSRSHGL